MTVQAPIHKRLKEARLAAGLSQKKLGIAAGIDEFVASARMNQYETGKHVPDYNMVQRIARVLKLPAAFFYTLDNKQADFLKKYASLTENQKLRLERIVEKMLKGQGGG